jgi:phage-related protein
MGGISMEQIEENVMHSFKLAKRDIIRLQQDYTELSQTQERLMEMLNNMSSNSLTVLHKIRELETRLAQKPAVHTKTIVKRIVSKAAAKHVKKTYVASKTGKSIHNKHCPFAQNIKPKSKIVFRTKAKALNKGYKLCDCLK